MRKFLILFGAVFVLYGLNGQSENYNDSLDLLYIKADNHFFTDQDSAYFYYDKVGKIATAKKDWVDVIDAEVSSNRVAAYHYDINEMKSHLKNLDSLMFSNKSYLDSLSVLPMYLTYQNFEKGNYYFLLNDFKKARKAFLKIVGQIEKLPDSLKGEEHISYLATSYNYLTKMMTDERKYDLAKMYCNKNIRFLAKVKGEEYLLHDALNLLAEVHKQEKNFEEANNLLLKTLESNLAEKNETTVLSILNIVQNHNYLTQLDSAQYYLRIANGVLDKDDPFKSSFLQVRAETQQLAGNYKAALNDFENARQLILQKWDGKKHWEIAHVLNKIGQLHSQFNQPQKAIESFDLAMEQLSGSTTAIYQSKMVQILKNKTQVLNQNNTKPEYLEAVLSVDLGITILDNLKPTFKSHADKLLLIEDVFPLFEAGITAAFHLYSLNNDEKYIDLALHYSEKSKSIVLLEALLASKATDFANIPEPLLERENQLKSEITFVEKKLNVSKSDAGKLADNLFDLKSEYRKLVEDIEVNYKTYYDLKYSTAVVSLEEIQEKLKADEKLISYFYGNKTIFAIGIGKTGKQFESIAIDSLFKGKIRNVQKMLADPKSDVDLLATVSHELYKIILEPFVKTNEPTKLAIVSDGLLNYIPFGALNTSLSGTSYLIEKHSVSYASSATLREQLSEDSSKNTDVLAFAPSFNGTAEVSTDRSKLLPLPHNKKEVDQVLRSFNGKSFLDDSATLENFKSELHNFGVLHFATHAIFDDALPEYSYLAFSQRGNKIGDDVLFTADLYNLKIDAALVTLSACETNIGELRKGEGFLSLTRGFFYSGAKSIVSTLWKVNDASSSEVMGAFYRQLSEGKTKDEALGQAQRLFLDQNGQNARKHPYYWAGYVASGNMTPIKQKTPIWAWLLGGTLLITGAAAVHAYRKKSA